MLQWRKMTQMWSREIKRITRLQGGIWLRSSKNRDAGLFRESWRAALGLSFGSWESWCSFSVSSLWWLKWFTPERLTRRLWRGNRNKRSGAKRKKEHLWNAGGIRLTHVITEYQAVNHLPSSGFLQCIVFFMDESLLIKWWDLDWFLFNNWGGEWERRWQTDWSMLPCMFGGWRCCRHRRFQAVKSTHPVLEKANISQINHWYRLKDMGERFTSSTVQLCNQKTSPKSYYYLRIYFQNKYTGVKCPECYICKEQIPKAAENGVNLIDFSAE